MIALHPEYVINEQKKTKAVLIPIDEWHQLLEAIEELDDIHEYDQVKIHKSEPLPFEQALLEIKGKSE